MKEIPLTRGLVAMVDDGDYAELSQYKWFAVTPKGKRTSYAARQVRRADGQQRIVFMHRQIVGASPGQKVDHWNHNGLDNQQHNLRIATSAQNAQNRLPNRRQNGKSTASRFKGVTWHKGTKRWAAQIQAGDKYPSGRTRVITIGYFPPTPEGEEAAARAYDRVAHDRFGEWGSLNFPEEWAA